MFRDISYESLLRDQIGYIWSTEVVSSDSSNARLCWFAMGEMPYLNFSFFKFLKIKKPNHAGWSF